jgi:hypothetical protein
VALRHGVSIVPGPVHSVSGGCHDHLRLPFVLDADVAAEGVHAPRLGVGGLWTARPPPKAGRDCVNDVLDARTTLLLHLASAMALGCSWAAGRGCL